ncbi:uncharacterized protein [Aquarana catesbeiana]|uniref:uncharacterized protein n=1 Tax=Aquarana catesbeiana TaxID=8400 RepID=UPI003CCA2259
MGEERSHMTERMLNLTLEIIYLLTGENYIAFKLSSGFVASRLMKGKSPFVEPPSHSLIHERRNIEKVQKATDDIIDLLKREVPIRCEDSTVPFSMEEWEYIEGHKDLYKDVMMENRPPLTSPDGSSDRNPPERCPRLLYSKDSTQEHQEIPQEDQDENPIHFKEEAREPYVMGGEACKEEDISPEISTDGQYKRKSAENYLSISSDAVIEDNEITYDSSEHQISENAYAVPNIEDPSSDPSLHEEHYPDNSFPALHTASRLTDTVLYSEYDECFIKKAKFLSHQNLSGELFSCSQCGISFSQKADLKKHKIGHAAVKPYSCSDCGKRFTRKSSLSTHEKLHSSVKPYSCSQCGKSFTDKSIFHIHQRIHTSEKPFSCPECGKCFAQSGNLSAHQRIHTGVKPFSCSECGELFSRKSSLVRHKKLHSGEKPFSCLECGKCFIQRGTLMLHQRTHTGDRPYPCSECGKLFVKRTSLMAHLNSHWRKELPTLGYSS